jgi:NlpE N-terminal domain
MPKIKFSHLKLNSMKSTFYLILLLSIATFCFQSCGGNAPKETVHEIPTVPTSAVDLPEGTGATPPRTTPDQAAHEEYAAFYSGLLPCKDCDGIQTLLLLNADKNRTYTLKEDYTGKQPTTIESSGNWMVKDDIITMSNEQGTVQYKGTEEGLVRLDRDGKVMDAKKYFLKKI